MSTPPVARIVGHINNELCIADSSIYALTHFLAIGYKVAERHSRRPSVDASFTIVVDGDEREAYIVASLTTVGQELEDGTPVAIACMSNEDDQYALIVYSASDDELRLAPLVLAYDGEPENLSPADFLDDGWGESGPEDHEGLYVAL